MTVDPVDDCTFWFTSEYYSANLSFNWRTRIASFVMPGCSGPAPTPTVPPTAPPAFGTISGHVSNADTGAPLEGASVSTATGGYSTTTNASGDYTIANVTPATYSVVASLSGFQSKTNAGVVVSSGGTATSNFALTPNPATTSFLFATTAAPVTAAAGDNNGYESGSGNLFATDGLLATDSNSGTAKSTSCTATTRDKEDLSGYSFGSVGPTVLGIQVQLRGRVNQASQSPRFCVQLSWDGGTTWSTGETTGNLSTTLTTYSLGTTANTWGHIWTAAQLGSSLFRVRVIDLASSTAKTFSLDSVTVAVTYQ